MKTGMKENIKKKGFQIRSIMSEPIGLLMAALLSVSFSTKAEVFTTQSNGNFTDPAVWSKYPGNIVREMDTVVIKNSISLNKDVIVKGYMQIASGSSLHGDANLVILTEGILSNKGVALVKSITNRGLIQNANILEASADFINVGKFENHQSTVVGNILDNTGEISGVNGQIMVNKRMVNAVTGNISGSVDICSNDFSNVGGAKIDSLNVSFCGNKIFNSTYLTASVKQNVIEINLRNSTDSDIVAYEVEKSEDGKLFNKIASIDAKSVKDNALPVNFSDASRISGNTTYYRMKIVRKNGNFSYVPAVEVGNIQAGKYSVNQL